MSGAEDNSIENQMGAVIRNPEFMDSKKWICEQVYEQAPCQDIETWQDDAKSYQCLLEKNTFINACIPALEQEMELGGTLESMGLSVVLSTMSTDENGQPDVTPLDPDDYLDAAVLDWYPPLEIGPTDRIPCAHIDAEFEYSPQDGISLGSSDMIGLRLPNTDIRYDEPGQTVTKYTWASVILHTRPSFGERPSALVHLIFAALSRGSMSTA
ncbi:MAG: hypothetical protein IPJ88_07020 [Myxococcales bacterium]|nr:MAG: hypothetical protein IPJ88_07020 [Myxococcales bacterium]